MSKLIALDIDGTLYNSKGEITQRTREVLVRAQEKGHILALASGRPAPGLFKIAKQLDMDQHHGLLIGYNGGVVSDCTNGDVIYSNTIPNKTAKELLRHLESYPVTPIVDDCKFIYTNEPEHIFVQHESENNLGIKLVQNVCNAVDFSPAKVLITAPEEILHKIEPGITEPFLKELTFVFSTPFFLEATPLNVHKASSLLHVCERLGKTKDDVIAFGDAQNDMEMLAFAGTGVAMGNAVEALKEIADMVTATNDEDGIAVALEKLGIV